MAIPKKEISNYASHIKTAEELANVLSSIQRVFIDTNNHRITASELNEYSDIYNSNRYTKFRIPKKNRRGFRIIFAPEERLKIILRCVNLLLQSLYNPKEYVTGFAYNTSVVKNATFHKSKDYVYNIDLKDFFYSINTSLIVRQLQKAPYFYSENVSIIIANLSSILHNSIHTAVLSQGSPASPILSNIVCGTMDEELYELSLFYNLTYSRYADDITFSSNNNVFHESNYFQDDLEKIITSNGFCINKKKERLQTKGIRQVVTGLVVNEKVNVSRSYIKDLRNLLYIWRRHGERAAQKSFSRKAKKYNKSADTFFINYLRGKLSYLSLVRGENDTVYLRLRNEFNLLLSRKYRQAHKHIINTIIHQEYIDISDIYRGHL